MKEAVSSFDLIAIVAEMQVLVGGHIDKIYQSGDDFYLKINLIGGGKQEVFLKPGKWLCLQEAREKPETPPPFAQALRRYLSNPTIKAITKTGFDRVVVFDLETEKKYQLVVELFGGGNLVLVGGGRTILCQRTQVLRNRQIKPGQDYSFPPPSLNPLDIDREEFHAKLRGGKGAVSRVLASEFNLGGLYAEELCLLAGVDKKSKASILSDGQLDGLFTALNNLIVAVTEDRRPALIMQDGKAIDAVPIDLQVYADKDRIQCSTCSEALSKFLETAKSEEQVREVEPGEDVAGRYQRRIQQQEESIKALKDEQMKCEFLAFFLFEHFQEFEELLKTMREGRQPKNVRAKSIDHERHTIAVMIGDEDSIELDYRKDVNGNAQMLYEKRRKAQEQSAKVEAALAETKNEMERAVKKAKKIAAHPKIKPTKQYWFEAYRWFISSEGFLVIGGRDARSNESLVRKHLKDGDRYAHAEVHGAPSVVIKDGAKAGDQTLREACEFALLHSKAWSSKLASGSAYWVMPEQVSKTPESGEYVPKGAFIIRGKRNYFKDLQVRVAIGEIDYEGHRKAMAGPSSAVAAKSRRYAVLEPGDISKEMLTLRLARVLEVPVEEVGRILPPGPFSIKETSGIELQEGVV